MIDVEPGTLVQIAGNAFHILIKDDVDTVLDDHQSSGKRVLAALGIGSLFVAPAVRLVGLLSKYAVKLAAARIAARAANEAVHGGEVFLEGVKRARSLQKPLTIGEREGEFASSERLKEFLGPAGRHLDWHHIVESRMAGRLESARVHNVENVVPLDRDLHWLINRYLERRNPLLASAKEPGQARSLRQFLLEDHPDNFAMHQKVGEEVLREIGGVESVESLKLITKRRFMHRLAEHTPPNRDAEFFQHVGVSLHAYPGNSAHIRADRSDDTPSYEPEQDSVFFRGK